jgi:imidazolonepropionase-like amidohydrolase
MSNCQILIENVHIWDGVSDNRTAKSSVLIEDNLIKKIGIDPSDVDDGVILIDGKGQTLMPGLIDSHTHMNF